LGNRLAVVSLCVPCAFACGRLDFEPLGDAGPTPDADISSGLLARWRFDESFGSTARDDVLGNDGALVSFSASPPWTAGRVDNALVFDGIDDHVSVAPTLSSRQSYTIMAWVNLVDNGMSRSIYSEGTSTGWENFIWFYVRGTANPANHLELRVWDEEISAITSATAIDANEWVHAAVTKDGTSYTVLVNGRLENTRTLTRTPIGIDRATVGALGRTVTTFFGSGLLDDVRIYDRALEPSEVLQICRFTAPTCSEGN
jgi:hypothetical protein